MRSNNLVGNVKLFYKIFSQCLVVLKALRVHLVQSCHHVEALRGFQPTWCILDASSPKPRVGVLVTKVSTEPLLPRLK